MSEAAGPPGGHHRRETKTLQFARFITRNRAAVAFLLIASTLFWFYPILNTIMAAAGRQLPGPIVRIDTSARALFPDHPFDEVYANRLIFASDGRIDHWHATPFDMEGKAVALRAIALREGISLARTAYVGDHANDLAAARIAGLAVGFNPKSAELEEACHAVVRSADLRDVLPHLL